MTEIINHFPLNLFLKLLKRDIDFMTKYWYSIQAVARRWVRKRPFESLKMSLKILKKTSSKCLTKPIAI
jgi:hypothetical protein